MNSNSGGFQALSLARIAKVSRETDNAMFHVKQWVS